MVELKVNIDCHIYGTWLAKQVGITFRAMGFSDIECLRAAKACLVMRTRVAGRTSWQWGGNWVIEDQ